MSKYRYIHGKSFESVNGIICTPYTRAQGYASIWTAYGRPSIRKVSIWNDWDEWFRECIEHNIFDGGYWFISGRNSMQFTIMARMWDAECNYYFKITREHNRVTVNKL